MFINILTIILYIRYSLLYLFFKKMTKNKQNIKINLILGLNLFLIGVITLFGIGYSAGWHIADEILSGTFKGNYNFTKNVSFNGNVNFGNILKINSIENTTKTSEFVKEFSGIIRGPGNWPSCTETDKNVKIGTIKDSSSESFIDITLYGSHRGHNNNNHYYDYRKWVVMVGDYLSSRTIQSAYGGKVEISDGTNIGNFNRLEIGSGKTIYLNVKPQCGSNVLYTYVVRYYSNSNFVPETQRVW